MTIVIFLVVLVILIVVHEAGHFFAAKIAGIRVDEFGIGFPPRALVITTKGETTYTLNWLPIGGFVKIHGEDGDAEKASGMVSNGRSFVDKNRFTQLCVLLAGIVMNLLFAFIVLSITFAIPAQRALTDEQAVGVPDAVLTVEDVLPGSPAAEQGLTAGDIIKQTIVQNVNTAGPSATAFIKAVGNAPVGTPVTLDLIRDGKEILISAIPVAGIVPNNPSQRALGMVVAPIGTYADAWWYAPVDGAEFTWQLTKATAVDLTHFLGGIVTFHADLSQVAGPIGIALDVGAAARSGLISLMSLTAFISINLALVNVLPFPALDGGRVLFVLIETITRRRIKPSVAQAINGLGFALLILLVIVVSAHDLYVHLV
jgi:regulator of sigma E protease